MGYPKVAAFFDSDDQFSVYRRFGYLHSRLLLYKQDELRELEERLQTMDNLDLGGDNDTKKCLKSRDLDDGRVGRPGLGTRKSLFEIIERKALEYGKLGAIHSSTKASNLTSRYITAAGTAACIHE